MQAYVGSSFLFFIASISLNQASASSLSLSDLQRIKSEVGKLSEIHELPCEVSPAPTEQVFLFDGALGFCPRYFYFYKPRPSERSDFSSYQSRLNQTEITRENWAIIAQLKSELQAERKFKNCLLVKQVLKENTKRGEALVRELHYYSKQGEKAASHCAELQAVGKASSSSRGISAIAYSMGVQAGLRFTQILRQKNIFTARMLSIDPVGRGLRSLTGVLLSQDNPLFEKPAGVKRWINFFQKQDHGSLMHADHLHLGIRGSRVVGADLNQEILAEDFETDDARLRGHVHILEQAKVQAALFAE